MTKFVSLNLSNLQKFEVETNSLLEKYKFRELRIKLKHWSTEKFGEIRTV